MTTLAYCKIVYNNKQIRSGKYPLIYTSSANKVPVHLPEETVNIDISGKQQSNIIILIFHKKK